MRPLVFLAALIALPAWADVYRWVDEKGVVNYSNEPPPAGIQATKLDFAPPSERLVIQRVAQTSKPPRGLEYRKYAALRRGLKESELLNIAGEPDLVRWDSKFAKTYLYLATEAEPFTTAITVVRGRVEEIERFNKY
jgi:hypothetical protein